MNLQMSLPGVFDCSHKKTLLLVVKYHFVFVIPMWLPKAGTLMERMHTNRFHSATEHMTWMLSSWFTAQSAKDKRSFSTGTGFCHSVRSHRSLLSYGSPRHAQALWKIASKLLSFMWSSYLDDFFSIVETEASRHTDLIISAMFSILGWRLSTEKFVAYDTVCKVLGVQFDLRMSGRGLAKIVIKNEIHEVIVDVCTTQVLAGNIVFLLIFMVPTFATIVDPVPTIVGSCILDIKLAFVTVYSTHQN
jgi:hypothetical protein